ncbi:hypothetical protein QF049_000904 [Paenibacillus sp. W4I10]|uniref:hypothetical protein n=1 Tax=Paenibacillus sp. W4I10 TaxID=3042298 RepID=UPI0027843CC6|nr:hypothetical protein [Paenibacillus sp. W4I10]MDQ0719643.1 hypothetical protein [Paenibacillus sp. W4I10]
MQNVEYTYICKYKTSKDTQQLKADLSSDSDIHMPEIVPYLLESNEVAAMSAPLELISETEQTKQSLPNVNTTGPDEDTDVTH